MYVDTDMLALLDFCLNWVMFQKETEKQPFFYVAYKEYTKFSAMCSFSSLV